MENETRRIAGVDVGSSLTKAVWTDEKGYRFGSTADLPLETLLDQMRQDHVVAAYAAGIGDKAKLAGLEITPLDGDPIDNEIILQAEGARRLCRSLPGRFLIVTIGTGTSYALVEDRTIKRYPLGNHISGGHIRGRAAAMGQEDYGRFIHAAARGKPLDLLVKDMIPEKAGTFEGQLVVASMGKATSRSSEEDIYASIINDVLTLTLRDILALDMVPDFHGIEHVVYLGSTVARIPSLKESLNTYTSLIGKHAHLPEHGEFALAMGAHHYDSSDRIPHAIKPLDGYVPSKGSLLAKVKGLGLYLRSRLK